MTRAPAFQFYPTDFLAGRVATYSLEEAGAYIMLLAYDWSLDGLPASEEFGESFGKVCPKLSRNSLQTFAKLCRTSTRKFERFWTVLHAHFVTCEDGRLRNPRLQRERDKQLAYSQAMSDNGKRGGRPKKPHETRGLTAAKPTHKPEESTPSPTPSPTTKTSLSLTAPDVEAVVAHYRAKHPTYKPGDHSRKAVARALKRGYTVEELCLGIDGNASDEWCVREKVHGLDFLMSEKKLDGFIAKGRPVRLVDDNGFLTAEGAARLGKAS